MAPSFRPPFFPFPTLSRLIEIRDLTGSQIDWLILDITEMMIQQLVYYTLGRCQAYNLHYNHIIAQRDLL